VNPLYVLRLSQGRDGFLLSPGAMLDHAEAANVHAYLKAGKEYGVYR